MSNGVFDLDAVRSLITEQQPPAVVVADTSVVVDWPDFTIWRASLGEVIFVLPALINVELEVMKRKSSAKQGEDPGSVAVRGYTDLCKKGKIQDGISIGEAGWFISVPIPMEDRVTPALKQWTLATQAYGSPDLMFVLLTMELAQLSEAPVVLATKDNGLFGLASSHGVPTYHFCGFPLTDLEECLPEPFALSDRDWEEVKSGLRAAAKKNAVSADLTLTSIREVYGSFGQNALEIFDDRPLPKAPCLLAEGVGTLHLDRVVPFRWGLVYSEVDYPFTRTDERSRDEEEEFHPYDPRPAFFPEAYLDCFGRDDDGLSEIAEALEGYIRGLAAPLNGALGMPTIVSPQSILKEFFYLTYVLEGLSSEGGSEGDQKSEFAKEYSASLGLVEFGANTILWRLAVDDQQGRVAGSLKWLFMALAASWEIGERKMIQLPA